jgi:hypothetical protein
MIVHVVFVAVAAVDDSVDDADAHADAHAVADADADAAATQRNYRSKLNISQQ